MALQHSILNKCEFKNAKPWTINTWIQGKDRMNNKGVLEMTLQVNDLMHQEEIELWKWETS